MYELNSVIVEGIVNDMDNGDDNYHKCSLLSNKLHKKNDEVVMNKVEIDVYSFGKLAAVCKEHMNIGQRVRIVGRIDTHINGNIILIAEHLEVRPEEKTSAFNDKLKFA